MLPADAFFWYAEAATPEMRPLAAGLFLLDRAPDRRRFAASVERLVACVPRFRQRVVAAPLSLSLPAWRDDPNFDLRYHLRQVALPEGARDEDLFELSGSLFATPLDHERPLWEGYLVTGLPLGRAAYFLKIHHSLMDGAGAVALFDALTQAGREDAVPLKPRFHAAAQRAPKGRWQLARDASQAATSAVLDLVEWARRPEDLVAGARRAMSQIGSLLGDLRAPAEEDLLVGLTTGVGRRVAGLVVPMARMRALKEALGVSLNDVVLLAVTGALARYHRHRGIPLRAIPCVVPMSLRDERDRDRLGNHVGAFRVLLPLDEGARAKRLERIRAQTHSAKKTRQGAAYGALMGLIGLVPAAVVRALARQASGRVHLICSNVPGPQTHRYIAGARIDAVMPFAPVMLGTPLSIALMSYGDHLGFGIDSDPASIPDPERIRDLVEAEFGEIERHAPRLRRPAHARGGRREAPAQRRQVSSVAAPI